MFLRFCSIIQNLYEDKIEGTITEERFKKMSEAYEQEQATLQAKIPELEEKVKSYTEQTASTSHFLELVQKYTRLDSLTYEVAREFLEKVVVHQAERINGKKYVRVEIYYNGIGKIDLPIEKA